MALSGPIFIVSQLTVDVNERIAAERILVQLNAVSYTHLTLPTTPYV